MLSRIHLSGHLDRMTSFQQQLVAQGMDVYKQIRADLAHAVPFWPLGLPGWDDPWIALGMRAERATYLVVWHRQARPGGTPSRNEPGEISLPVVPGIPSAVPRVLYPIGKVQLRWDATTQLTVLLPQPPSACLIAFGEA
jgi:alpha-galactosidase